MFCAGPQIGTKGLKVSTQTCQDYPKAGGTTKWVRVVWALIGANAGLVYAQQVRSLFLRKILLGIPRDKQNLISAHMKAKASAQAAMNFHLYEEYTLKLAPKYVAEDR